MADRAMKAKLKRAGIAVGAFVVLAAAGLLWPSDHPKLDLVMSNHWWFTLVPIPAAVCALLVADLRSRQRRELMSAERFARIARPIVVSGLLISAVVGLTLIFIGISLDRHGFTDVYHDTNGMRLFRCLAAGEGLLLGMLIGFGTYVVLPATRRDDRGHNRRHCWDCGYDLAGLESTRCPECGSKQDSPRTTSRWLEAFFDRPPIWRLVLVVVGAAILLATISLPFAQWFAYLPFGG
jgi:hypothetical protein